MDDYFFKALHPPKTEVCGVKLRTYSNWHKACLFSLQSPFLEYEEEFTPSDLLVAVRVLCTEWPNQPDLDPKLVDVLRRWRLDSSKERFEAASSALVQHILDCSATPRFWDCDNDTGRMLTGPGVLSVVTSLIDIGFTASEAWNMPPGLSNWHIAVDQERKGDERRFLWESDLQDELPDWESVDDDTLYKQAVKDIGEKRAKAWINARKESKRNARS